MVRKSAKPAGRPRLEPDVQAMMRLVEAGRYLDVESSARRILGYRKNHPLALKALSFALIGMGRHEEALPILNFALIQGGLDAELHNNLGIALHSLLRWDEAEASFNRALALQPNDPEIWKNLGVACLRQKRFDDAVRHLLKAIEVHPGDYAEAVMHLADALSYSNRLEEALVCLRELHADDPDNCRILNQLLSISLRICEWGEFDERLDHLRQLSGNFSQPVGQPFGVLAFPGLDGDELRQIAENYVRLEIPPAMLSDVHMVPATGLARKHSRLRIGYLSADYRQHPVAFVIAELIERHDRERFEVFAYSISKNDDSEIRQRLQVAFEHFVDVSPMSVHATANRIASDEIDVLIDLNGWTSDGRPEVLALRPAPIQANWLGFAGTIGHGHLADYLIGDPIATPSAHSGHFLERLALLGNCYLPADTTRLVGDAPSRRDAGLPDDVFVYCSFNNSYKYNAGVWDLWASILQRATDSVLWLSATSPAAQQNLRREIEMRGVAPDRLVFAPRTNTQSEHLARLQLADVALDPFPYNSHSTAIDALWAGVPLVTVLGKAFPGRVGASVLTAAGLGNLVANTLDEYLHTALDLFQRRDHLATIRSHLLDGRSSLPLFDMRAFARNLEELYEQFWQRLENGNQEQGIECSSR